MVQDVARLVESMDRMRVETIVNLDGTSYRELQANLDRYDQRYPGRFATFAHLPYEAVLSDPSRGTHYVQAATRLGARGIKVWKDLGLSVRDATGMRVPICDRRLHGAWEAAAEAGVPVLIHPSEPRPFFDAPDRLNERVEELREHHRLQLHRGNGPSWNQLLDEFEALVESAPDTTFIAAHLANCGDDLDTCDDLFARHPNLFMDISARLAELGRQPRRARAFLLRHRHRVLFGTDNFPPTSQELRVWVRALETEDEYFPYTSGRPIQGRWMIYGLGLDNDVLADIYHRNARRLLSTPT
jgi:predicted TIM-barrel fold metal-dependent hydrolase